VEGHAPNDASRPLLFVWDPALGCFNRPLFASAPGAYISNPPPITGSSMWPQGVVVEAVVRVQFLSFLWFFGGALVVRQWGMAALGRRDFPVPLCIGQA
jgi:hypothetical protein